MKKFYHPPESPTHYWEHWEEGRGRITVHWGKLGETGERKLVSRRGLRSAKSIVREEEAAKVAEGYREIDLSDHAVLWVEHAVEAGQEAEALDRRHALEEELNEVLGWSGLGECDGGSIGSGTMEVCCFVVDFALAERVVAEKLSGTEYADYTRIYRGG